MPKPVPCESERRSGPVVPVPLTGRLILSNGAEFDLDGYAVHIASLVGVYQEAINGPMLGNRREVTAVLEPRKVWFRFSETTPAQPLGEAKYRVSTDSQP